MNQNSMKRRLTAGLCAAALVLVAAGCKHENKKASTDFFSDPEGYRSLTSTLAAQSANGARQDGMLYAAHFNGADLNSNGQAKLNRMLAADAGEPVVVYLNVPTDDATLLASREDSVSRYLKDAGVPADKMKLETGANPGSWTPAAPLITGLAKTDTGSTADAGATGDAAVPASGDSSSAPK